MRASTAALVVVGAFVASESRAEVRVTACAELGAAPVDIQGSVPFVVELARDPAAATSAWLELTAFDPDRGEEVALAVNGTAQDPLSRLEWNGGADFNDRSSSYSAPLALAQLVPGANQIVFTDQDDESPFLLERLCITLVDAPPPSPRPAREIFCADNVRAESPFTGTGGQRFDIGDDESLHIELDIPVSPAARVGLDVIAFENGGSGPGTYTLTLTRGAASLSGSFTAGDDPDHYLVRTAPEPSALLTTGGSTLDVTADWSGRLWGACVIVEDEVEPIVDAGPPPVEPVDAGAVPDAGVPVDAGAPPPDAGSPPAPDAGEIAPDDAGQAPRGDASVPSGEPAEDPRGLLAADDFQVVSSCASTPPGALWTALGLLGALGLLRRRRGAR